MSYTTLVSGLTFGHLTGKLGELGRKLTTRDIALAACMHFGLEFVSEAEFNSHVNNTVRAQLYQMAGEGRVSTARTVGPGTMRWT